MSIQDDKDRIEYIIRQKGMSNIEFSAVTGIAPATISHIFSGRSKPTLKIFKNIVDGFPDLNPTWVFLGEGPVYKADIEVEAADQPQDVGTTDGNLDLFSSLGDDSKSKDSPSFEKGKSGKKAFAAAKPIEATSEIKEVIKETVAAISARRRQIVEVRIFFDDGTYEAFNTPK